MLLAKPSWPAGLLVLAVRRTSAGRRNELCGVSRRATPWTVAEALWSAHVRRRRARSSDSADADGAGRSALGRRIDHATARERGGTRRAGAAAGDRDIS